VASGTLLLSGAGASPARANPAFFGQTVFSHVRDAVTIKYQLPARWDPMTAATAFVLDPANHSVNSGTTPFYVGIYVYGIGDNGLGKNGGGGFYAEFVPPLGVTILTQDPSYPPFWQKVPVKNGKALTPVRQRAPLVFDRGADPGGVRVSLSGGAVFRYAVGVNRVLIYVPVETTRKLSGIRQPSCPQIHTVSPVLLSGETWFDPATYQALLDDDDPVPCPPNKAYNDLQVAVYAADGGWPKELVPWVEMITSGPDR